MVCYRISGTFYILSSAPKSRINQADTYLTTALSQGIALPDDHYTKTTLPDGTILFDFSIRYSTPGARDLLKSNILDRLQSYVNTAYFSLLEIHTCHHDQTPPQPCVDQVMLTWGVM